MAQANSVQREPTMEEILASIRRIIEDSDAGAKQANDSFAPNTLAPAPTPGPSRQEPKFEVLTNTAADRDADMSIDDGAFDMAAVRAVSDALEREMPSQPMRREAEERAMAGQVPFSQAAISQAAKSAPQTWQATATAAPRPSEQRIEPAFQERTNQDRANQERERPAFAEATPVARASGNAQVTPDKASFAPARPHMPEMRAQQPAVEGAQIVADGIKISGAAHDRVEKEAPRQDVARPDGARHDAVRSDGTRPDAARADVANILSAQAGQQIAAAFGELNEALEINRRREFDEMAKAMLRPMLQDWLDNNLPTLVEKLVREEIERIARGDR